MPGPAGVTFQDRLSASTDIVHLFVTRRAQLERGLASIPSRMRADAVVSVSWPKRAAKQPTDVTERMIREIALPMGLVVRKELR